jgi:cytochrome c
MRSVYSAVIVLAVAVGLGAHPSTSSGWPEPVEGQQPASGQAATEKPDETRFTPVVVVPNGELDEPMAFEVTPDERVYIIERKGAFKVFDPVTRTVKPIANLRVNTKYISASGVVREGEEGLIGLTLDPNFDRNRWVYLLNADPNVSKHVLARWELGDDRLVAGSRRTVLEFMVQRETCCHTGGGMTWDAKGNLYLTVGNNTGNVLMAQTDERPGRHNWDDQRGAANTNDLRGKILRIHPEPDGSYTIPPGNLFPPGTPATRPEIYTMGHRNVWRVSVDNKTGYIYWGEVGPDAGEDSEIGPRGYDEMNQAKAPGFFGWPYFIGENHAYPYWDYFKNKPAEKKDPKKPVNNSVNNTGLKELPPAQPAFISYPYSYSEKFPEVGTGSRSAAGGPVYRRADFKNPARPFPAYYEGKWLMTDFSRGWIIAVTMDEKGNYQSMERFLPSYKPVEPIDMKFGPTGDLYVLEYGSNWHRKSDDARLVRVEYNAGNRVPFVEITASRTGGAVPFQVTLSSTGTKDYDGDPLTYEWELASEEAEPRTFRQAETTVSFDKPGVYVATLTAKDSHGAENSKSVTIIAGNEPPKVALDVKNAVDNKTFFFPNRPIAYGVKVSDKEDGALVAKTAASRVAVSIDYAPEGFDAAVMKQGEHPVDPTTRFALAKALIARSDCRTCHNVEGKSNGPSFKEMAAKYRADAGVVEQLAKKVRTGGSGVWGEAMMPAHPAFTMHEARSVVTYMLSIDDKKLNVTPLSGSHTPKIPDGDSGRGSVIFRAVYTDRGAPRAALPRRSAEGAKAGAAAGAPAERLPAHTTEAMTVLRAPQMSAGSADVMVNASTRLDGRGTGPATVVPKRDSHIAFKNIDLTGIKALDLMAVAPSRDGNVGGTIEVRLGSPAGSLLGQADVKVMQPPRRPAMPEQSEDIDLGPVVPTAPAGATGAAGAPGGPQTTGVAPTLFKGGAPPPPGGIAPGTPAAQGVGGGAGTQPEPPAAGAAARQGTGGLGRFRRPQSIRVEIAPTSGTHDIYFVFKNDTAKPIQPLMSFSTITFVTE